MSASAAPQSRPTVLGAASARSTVARVEDDAGRGQSSERMRRCSPGFNAGSGGKGKQARKLIPRNPAEFYHFSIDRHCEDSQFVFSDWSVRKLWARRWHKDFEIWWADPRK